MRTSPFTTAIAMAALSSFGLYGQSVISAHSGVLHYSEGDVTIDGQTPNQKPGTFAEVKEKQELETQVGRAEVLLTPGVFLRLGENSGIRMISNRLSDTELGFLKGSAILDFVEVMKDNSVKVHYQDYDITFLKKGIYRFDSEPAQLKVYAGEAVVSHGGSSTRVKEGREVPFTPALVNEKFDNRTGDALYRWAKRRSEYIAVANLSAARRAGSGYTSSGVGSWYYNPYYSMFTFIPARGILCDPFTLYACYYSPASAWEFYYPRPAPNYGGGYNGGFNSAGYYPTSIGTSSTLSTYNNSASYSGPSVASPGAASAHSSGGFSSGGAAATGGGGFSGGGGGGGGGAAAHGGGGGGGHGK